MRDGVAGRQLTVMKYHSGQRAEIRGHRSDVHGQQRKVVGRIRQSTIERGSLARPMS